MVTVDKAVIAKIEKGGKRFEILVDPELAYEFREKGRIDKRIIDILAIENVFKDSKKGMPASKQDIIEFFGTDNIEKVAEKILREGEIQLTTEFKRKKLEARKMQIAEFISKNSVDPRTKTPHPPQRILNAIEQAKVHIDIFKNIDEEIEKTIKAISHILPLSFEKIKLEIKIPSKYASKCYGYIKSLGSEPKWLDDGSLYSLIEIPSGLKDEIFKKINYLTNGENSILIK
jgi:ribosome maturation protein SDO1